MKALLIAALLGSCVAAPVMAQDQCADRDRLVTYLQSEFGETAQAIGLVTSHPPNVAVMEMYANVESGTWTMSVTRPDGVMCIITSGENYEPQQGVLPPAGIDG